MIKLPEPVWISLQKSLDLVISLTGADSEDAKRALLEAFTENKIRTRGREQWTPDKKVNQLLGLEWKKAGVLWGDKKMLIRVYGTDSENFDGLEVDRVEVDREQVMQWLETTDSAPQRDSHQTTAKDKGGRNPTYDWAVFQKEILRIANTPDGLSNQRDLVKLMSNWCGVNWAECPEERTIRRKVKEYTDGVIPPG